MASPTTTYEPRQPASGVLHQVVRDHFETFRVQAVELRDGEGLPSFVEQEFRDFLRGGSLGGGFARFRCTGCGFDRLVPLSCHGRGFCPSCGGRRMAERAAHLVDRVFPRHGDTMRFYPGPPLDAADVDEVLATVTAYIASLVAHGGSGDGDDSGMLDAWADEAPVLAGLAAASVQGRVALGSRAGARVRRRGGRWAGATERSGLGPCQARYNGFDLHAGLCVPADQRNRWSESPDTLCVLPCRRNALN